ncbi:MAG: hypothetical protein ACYCXT_11450 [Acidiferrobacteraceae bacterium]
MLFADIIQQWFKDEWGGGLVLPDGWYGRPYDSQLSLTSVAESGDTLTLVLQKKLTLHFRGVKAVERRNRDLVIGPFDRLRFEWESFGDDGSHGAKDYQSGEAKIVVAPG